MITFKAVVYQHYQRKDGTYPIRVRVTINRQSKQISTTLIAHPHQLTKGLKIKDRELQRKVDELLMKLRSSVSGIDLFTLKELTPSDIIRYINTKSDGVFRLDFLSYGYELIEGMSYHTKNFKRSALREFARYMGMDTIDISLVTSSRLRGFEAYLREKNGDSSGTMHNYLSALAYIHKRAREKYNDYEIDVIRVKNPFEFYRIPKLPRAPKRALTAEQMQQIISVSLPSDTLVSFARDMFVLSFALIGMNAVDLYSAKGMKDGILSYNRSKTKGRRDDNAEMKVRIEREAASIIARYPGKDGYLLNLNRRYATISNLNKSLSIGMRKLAKIVDIEGLTFYAARHTWATMAYSIGINKALINDCLCHVDKDMRITDIYIRRDWGVIWEANRKVIDMFNW